jgi:hypothetical protein
MKNMESIIDKMLRGRYDNTTRKDIDFNEYRIKKINI